MDDGSHDAERRVRERLEHALDGYFDVRTAAMVERVLGAATVEELEDPAAMDELFQAFVTLLDERYGRADPGWRDSAERFLKTEFERQVDAARAFNASFDEL